MRLYDNPKEALSEIQRDLYKGPQITFSRVQQREGQVLPGRELLLYTYAIENHGWPETPEDMLSFGVATGMIPDDVPNQTKEYYQWVRHEYALRMSETIGEVAEHLHPALSTAFEGNWPSYTYGERLYGSQAAILRSLAASPDSRRAFWPIFRPEDSFRAGSPTRVPCSLGYQMMIRNTRQGPRTILIYFQRSADFDTFFWSDIWFAHMYQKSITLRLAELDENEGLQVGQFMHVVSSLHSFSVEGTEVY